ncbi:microprocessor complex subunit DGCR8 isoform X1 [Anastrepha obliqua]|uniref:microprocessor complex subunit DGCR8 isoform X1 n=1 Tax=Anastrepha obliqua TaxID=95512 RepID=UPI00240A3285|nr:microprocessor complex subunit DGCR8 isoform X1 [Anastrepha obliqua]
MSSESDNTQRSPSSPPSLPSSPQPHKRMRLDEQTLHEEATAMKEKGFSLSAIEEMKTRVEESNQSGVLDQQLRQFQVLDEVQGSGSEDSDIASENGDQNHEHGDGYESSDLDIDDNEIENLLNENLPDDLKEPKKPKYEERFKTVLEEKGHNHFEVLPEGWVQVTHNSGMPLFLHKQSRVVSASRPYFLGHGSVRKHAIPLGAIPCLNYRRALEEEEAEIKRLNEASTKEGSVDATRDADEAIVDNIPKCPYTGAVSSAINPTESSQSTQVSSSTNGIAVNNETMDTSDLTISTQTAATLTTPASTSTTATATATATTTPGDLAANIAALKSLVPPAKIVTVTENTQNESLTPEKLNQYCTKLFKFKVIRVLRFRSWNARRKFTKNRKHIKNLQRPTLPDGTKLIKFPILAPSGDASANTRGRKEWIMNPNGKSYVCILHEYVQHALKKQPTYEFKELENAATPYSATVSINELKYGTGYGTSKKQAKSDAARETLEILIPEMKDKITGIKQDKNAPKSNHKDLSVFDDIKIQDPRVAEFCNKTTEPSPHAILLTCLQRNFGLGDVQINYEINRTKNKKNEFTMTVGKHTAKVLCKNKREGKQLASQAILQILHPHIKTWGSLLRLYGNNSIKTFKEKKLEEQEITVLQSKAAINQPNYAILDKLKAEMLKLAEKNKSVKSMGTFVPPSDVDLPSSSGSNLNNVEL